MKASRTDEASFKSEPWFTFDVRQARSHRGELLARARSARLTFALCCMDSTKVETTNATKSALPIFYPCSAVARGFFPVNTLQVAVAQRRVDPDAWLAQPHRRPVALFTEGRVETIRAKLAEKSALQTH